MRVGRALPEYKATGEKKRGYRFQCRVSAKEKSRSAIDCDQADFDGRADLLGRGRTVRYSARPIPTSRGRKNRAIPPNRAR